MSHFWIQFQEKASDLPAWAVVPLAPQKGPYFLTRDPKRPLRIYKKRNPSTGPRVLGIEGQDTWALISRNPFDARINGLPLLS